MVTEAENQLATHPILRERVVERCARHSAFEERYLTVPSLERINSRLDLRRHGLATENHRMRREHPGTLAHRRNRRKRLYRDTTTRAQFLIHRHVSATRVVIHRLLFRVSQPARIPRVRLRRKLVLLRECQPVRYVFAVDNRSESLLPLFQHGSPLARCGLSRDRQERTLRKILGLERSAILLRCKPVLPGVRGGNRLVRGLLRRLVVLTPSGIPLFLEVIHRRNRRRETLELRGSQLWRFLLSSELCGLFDVRLHRLGAKVFRVDTNFPGLRRLDRKTSSRQRSNRDLRRICRLGTNNGATVFLDLIRSGKSRNRCLECGHSSTKVFDHAIGLNVLAVGNILLHFRKRTNIRFELVSGIRKITLCQPNFRPKRGGIVRRNPVHFFLQRFDLSFR